MRFGGPTVREAGHAACRGRPESKIGGVIMTGGLTAVALVLCSANASPSEPHEVEVGCRVRVGAPATGAAPLIGVVVGLEPQAVLVQEESSRAPTRVALSPTTTIEVSGGRRSKAGQGAVLGAAVGAMPGL